MNNAGHRRTLTAPPRALAPDNSAGYERTPANGAGVSDLYPGLRRAAEICRDLAGECDAKIAAAPSPYTEANVRRKAESRALRRAASRITDAMLDEPIGARAEAERPLQCRRVGCQRPTTHPSGMCDEHQPGFAQAIEQDRAA